MTPIKIALFLTCFLVCGCSTIDIVYVEKVNECLVQVKNLSELGGDDKCREVQNEWMFVVKRELDKEIKIERVVLILMAFDYYSLKYLNAYDNFNKDEVDFTMVYNRIKYLVLEHEAVALSWAERWRRKGE